MFARLLSAMAVCLGLIGSVAAQPAARLGKPTESVVQVRWQEPTPAPEAPATPQGTPASPLPTPFVPPPVPVTTMEVPLDPMGGAVWEEYTEAAIEGGPSERIWVTADWLYWSAHGNPLPPLLTTAPPGTPRDVAGTLGGPGTRVVYGGFRVNDDFRNGLRTTAGLWLGDRLGVEANFFFLGRSRQGFAAGSDGSQIVTRPFFDVPLNRQNSQVVSFPGQLAGATAVDATSDLIGGGGNLLWNMRSDPFGRLDLLLGYRYLNLTDDVFVLSQLRDLAGTRFTVADQFRTENHFHGPLVGVNWERRWSHWFVGLRASVAMGVAHQVSAIAGTSTFANGTTGTFPGGLLAQPTNIGVRTRDRFAVLPEVGFRVGAQVTDRMRVSVGYDYLYWSRVARAGDQIDLRLNPSQLPPAGRLVGTPAPVQAWQSSGFWAQGLNFGLEFRF